MLHILEVLAVQNSSLAASLVGMPKCREGALLMEAWNRATKEFSAAVSALAANLGRLPKVEYERLRMEAEAARLAMDNARLLIDMHQKEHGC